MYWKNNKFDTKGNLLISNIKQFIIFLVYIPKIYGEK